MNDLNEEKNKILKDENAKRNEIIKKTEGIPAILLKMSFQRKKTF